MRGTSLDFPLCSSCLRGEAFPNGFTTLKFLHAADVHLDSPLRGLRNKSGAPLASIRIASRRALENLVSLAKQEEVDFVVVAGDLFDGDRDNYDTSHFFVNQAAKLREAGIPLVLIRGNHDAQSKMTRDLIWPANVKEFGSREAETITGESIGIHAPLALHGWSFANASEQRNLAADYPRPIKGLFNLGILHTSLTGAEGHDKYAPCTLDDLAARGYEYWALGHIHQRDWLPRRLENGAAPVVFPGNLQGRHIKETGPKGCYLVEADAEGVKKQTFHTLDVFRWEMLTVDASLFSTVEDCYEQCARQFQNAHRAADNRQLALRVTCVGHGVTFDRLAVKQSKVEAELLNLIAQSYDDQIWLENVRFVATPQTIQPKEELSDAVSEYLRRELSELASGKSTTEYAGAIEDLLERLPDELVDSLGIELDTVTQSTWWREIVSEMETLMWARLRQHGAETGATR
jgi:DNA repair protein SbcD/Mre11